MGVRAEIVSALKTLLETISPGNGYLTDLGLNVYEWREYAFSSADMPCINIKDMSDTIESDTYYDYIIFSWCISS